MARLATLEFYPVAFNFSSAHFTLFSATSRERLHGHNYSVAASLTAKIHEPGLTFDYAIFKKKLTRLCEELDSYLILPGQSPYLKITERSDHYEVHFDSDQMFFLKKDTLILPIANTTLEDFSQWFIDRLTSDADFLKQNDIHALTIKVFNSPNQSGSAHFGAENTRE